MTSPTRTFIISRRPLGVFAGVLIALAAGAPDAAVAQSLRMDWNGTRLSIAATRVPLASVLTELARRTASTIVGVEHATRLVSVDIRHATIVDALKALLADADLDYLYIPRLAETTASYDGVRLYLRRTSRGRSIPADCSAGRRGCEPGPAAGVAEPTAITAGPAAPVRRDGVDGEVARLVSEGFFDTKATEGALLSATTSQNREVRVRALQTLALQNTPAGHAEMVAASRDNDPFVRAEAIELLLHVADPKESAARLGDLLQHEDAAMRFAAAAALGEHTSPEAEFQLRRAQGDDDASVQAVAAQSLRQQDGQRKNQRPRRER